MIALMLTIYANCRVMAISPGAYGFKLQPEEQLQDNTPPRASLSRNLFDHGLYRFIHSLSNAIIVLVIIIMIYYIYCKYVSGREREKQLPVHTVLLVALYTKDDAFTKQLMITQLHLTEIKLLNLWNFQLPTLSGWTTLQFNWSFLRAPITLSKSIDISIADHFKVNKCLADLYALRIIALNAEEAYELFCYRQSSYTKVNFDRRRARSLREGSAPLYEDM